VTVAENIVEIVVRSKNDTRAGFDEAKADAEIAGEEAGQGFMAKFGSWLVGGQTANGGGGIGGILSTIFSTGPIGIGALAGAFAAALTLIVGVVNGLSAAALGLGALAIVALPTLDKIKNAYTSLSTVQAAYNTAVEKQKMDPTKANAAAVATALLNLKVAQQQAGPMAVAAVAGINALRTSFDKMAQSFQPQILGIFNQALGIAAQLLPVVATFAKAAAPAVSQIMTALGKSISSAGFKEFVSQFSKISGPAIAAVGQGIGKVIAALGQMFTVMSAHDVVHALNITFDAIVGLLMFITATVKIAMVTWDQLSSHIAAFARAAGRDLANWAQVADNIFHNVEIWFTVTLPAAGQTAINWFHSLPGKILAAIGNLGSLLFTAGANAVQRLIDGLVSKIGSVASAAASIASKIAGFFGLSPAKEGPLSGAGAPELRGAHFTEAVASGMRSRLAAVAGAAGSVAGAAGSAGGGSGGGVHVSLEIAGSSNTSFDAFMLQWVRNKVRLKGGGSVQAAFGKAGM
jgi:hypothetical protein